MEIKKGGRRQGGVWVQMKATGKRFQTSRVKGLAAIISGVLEKGMLKDGDCVRTGKESGSREDFVCPRTRKASKRCSLPRVLPGSYSWGPLSLYTPSLYS